MRGMRGLIKALNVIYEVEEQRGFWHRQALAFAFCCFGGGFLLIAIGLIVGMPPYISGSESKTAFIILAPSRWPILILALMISLSVLYRYGPSRRAAKWRWVSWGATASATTWVAGSFLFSYYASRYTRLNSLLGSLG